MERLLMATLCRMADNVFGRRTRKMKKTAEEIASLRAKGKHITEERRIRREETVPINKISYSFLGKVNRDKIGAGERAELEKLEKELEEIDKKYPARTPEEIAAFRAEGRTLSAERRALRKAKTERKKMPVAVFVLWAVCVVLVFVFWPSAIALAIFILVYQKRLF